MDVNDEPCNYAISQLLEILIINFLAVSSEVLRTLPKSITRKRWRV